MMMNFVLLTLSIMVAILLASALAFVVMLNTKVMKWYMKKMFKMTTSIMTDEDIVKVMEELV